MGIPDEDVAQVRAATDIVALIGEHAALKRQGQRWVGLCPFHTEKTPSFSVNAEEGFYYCFGCQKSGDAITFVRETEHLDFVEAVRRLADRTGITLHEDAAGGRDSARRRRLARRHRAAPPSGTTIGCSPAPTPDRPGTTCAAGATTARWSASSVSGWAPDDWDALCVGLGLEQELATSTGLGFVNRRGRLQDAFRGRILFPICDPSGHPVALGGRVLPGSADPAKYKNSAETAVYSKRRTLYALNWAKHDVVATGEVVVCEGYTDVIGFFEAGVERAVATCGTALGEEHVHLLRNFARRVVLAFDADAAGQSAATRFYEWERRYEIDVAVADLPPGCDPAELAKEDPGRSAGSRRGGEALPAVPGGLAARCRRLVDRRGTGQGGGTGSRDRGRAPRRPRARPVRHDPRRTLPSRTRAATGAPRRTTPRSRDGDAAAEIFTFAIHRGATTDERRNGSPSGAAANGTSHASGRPPRRAIDREFRPGLEALRLAIHRPEEIDGRLEAVAVRRRAAAGRLRRPGRSRHLARGHRRRVGRTSPSCSSDSPSRSRVGRPTTS